MKKTFVFIIGLCIAIATSAEPIGKQAALYTARTFMQAKGKSIDAVQKPFRAARQQDAQAGNRRADTYYYVFNAGGDDGYVIVSGDDRTEPILGYVEQGSFDPDNIPENMRSWLQSYADQIKYIIDNDLKPDSPHPQEAQQGSRHQAQRTRAADHTMEPGKSLQPHLSEVLQEGGRHSPSTILPQAVRLRLWLRS